MLQKHTNWFVSIVNRNNRFARVKASGHSPLYVTRNISQIPFGIYQRHRDTTSVMYATYALLALRSRILRIIPRRKVGIVGIRFVGRNYCQGS